MALAVTLLVLRCADLERSRRLFEAVGLSFRTEQHAIGPRHYSARVGETVLELCPRRSAGTSGLRFGLRVQDLPEVVARVESAGGKVVEATAELTVFEDFDGHKIELTADCTRSVSIDTSRIVDWDSFHDVFAAALGFPGFYGRNMNAWIDCMSALDFPDDRLTVVHVAPGETLTLELDGVDAFAKRCPAVYEALIDCAAFVNWRRRERGQPAVLVLSFRKHAHSRDS